MYIPNQLTEVAEKVAQGQQPTSTVRTLLSWFWNSQRRGSFIVSVIRNALATTKLVTVPDFDATYLDGKITFVRAAENPQAAKMSQTSSETAVAAQDSMVLVDLVATAVQVDPSYRIARLKSAHTVPLSVSPEATVGEAVTLMMKFEYSQLPVMVGERTVKGAISWKSLGKRLPMNKQCIVARDAMESVHVVELDTSLFDAVPLIAKYDCVLVKDGDNKICGIMTPFDIGQTFVELGEPFLLIGEIENHLREMTAGKFSKAELEEARDPLDADRPIKDVSDLNFGGYVRLLQRHESWEKMRMKLDRATFINYLEQVRVIRNNTMHFDPDGIEDSELKELREFSNLLRQIDEL
jgi:predicted transcriptional regulator